MQGLLLEAVARQNSAGFYRIRQPCDREHLCCVNWVKEILEMSSTVLACRAELVLSGFRGDSSPSTTPNSRLHHKASSLPLQKPSTTLQRSGRSFTALCVGFAESTQHRPLCTRGLFLSQSKALHSYMLFLCLAELPCQISAPVPRREM